MSESRAVVRHIAEIRTQLQDDIAERHRISQARLEEARSKAVENRKKRRLSAPASLRGPGGKHVARRSSRLRASLQSQTMQGSDTETDPLREARPPDDGTAQSMPVVRDPTNVHASNTAIESAAPRSMTRGDDVKGLSDANTQSVCERTNENRRNAEYVQHGITLTRPSIDKNSQVVRDDLDDICHVFQECELDETTEEAGFDIPPPALTACLDTDEWERVGVQIEDENIQAEDPQTVHNSVERPVQRLLENPTVARHSGVNTDTLSARLKAVLTWEKFVSYMAICGRAPFSAEQYQLLKGFAAACPGDHRLHEYKTIRRQMSRNLSDWCFPKSEVLFVGNVECPRGTAVIKTVKTSNAGRKAAQACVLVVMPTEWAKLDVASYTFYSDIFEHPQSSNPETLSIEQAPIVQRRAPFIGREQKLWVWYKGTPCYARYGDLVSIPCSARPQQVEKSRKAADVWFPRCDSSERTPGYASAKAVVCGVWVIGRVPCLGERRSPRTLPPPEAVMWSDRELAVQQKFSQASPSSDAMETVLQEESKGKRKRSVETDAVHTQTRLGYSTNVVDLNPGDQCVLLRSEFLNNNLERQNQWGTGRSTTQHCMLIGSLVRQAMGLSVERLVWVDVEDDKEDGGVIVHYVGSTNVTDMPTWLDGSQVTPTECYKEATARNRGYLPDGSRYVVYRFALYMDGFKQTKSLRDKRSVGGCYIIPLGLSLDARRNTGAPHVITLASSGLPHNEVLKLVMGNVTEGSTKGISAVDPYGRRVRIYLDLVSFFGDYPAAALCTDTVGHIGNSFCTHCSIMKRRSPSTSRILCMRTNHCRRTGFMRTDARMAAIRESPVKVQVLRSLGMKSKDKKMADKLPLVHLSSLCRSATPQKNDRKEDVVPVMFESSMSCAAVPDHLFNGLIKNMLNVLFEAVGDNIVRRQVERRIMSMLQENGLPVTGRLLKWGSRMEYAGLQNQTMTGFMCILLCSATAFEDIYLQCRRPVFRLARLLQQLVGAVYFWPCRRVDGEHHNYMFTVEGRLQYYAKLISMCTEYLAACEGVMVDDVQAGAVLDKPNAHRSLELVMHTIPTFGHARNCSEMVLELMHQVFKRWLERNTHQDSHLTAVERALAKDWMGRLFALYSIWMNGDSKEQSCSEVGLRRLILGEEGMILDERQPGVEILQQEFQAALRSTLRPPNTTAMGKCGHVKLPRAQLSLWCVTAADKATGSANTSEAIAGMKMIEQLYGLRVGWGGTESEQYNVARLRVFDMYERAGNTYKYNELRVGQVLSAVCDANATVIGDDSFAVGELMFFAVYAILQVKRDKKLWAICRRMCHVGDVERDVYCVGGEDVVIVELGSGVRRAGAAHICDDQCRAPRGSASVLHSRSVLGKGRYELWSRKDGFPPYMG